MDGDFPEDMIYEILKSLLEVDPDDALRFCALNKRTMKVCNRVNVQKMIIEHWEPIVQGMREDARYDLGDAFDNNDINLLIKSQLEDQIPEIRPWFLKAMNLEK